MDYSNKIKEKNELYRNIKKRNIENMASISGSSIAFIIFLVVIYIIVSIVRYKAWLKGDDFGPFKAALWPLTVSYILLQQIFSWFGESIKRMGNDSMLSNSQPTPVV